MFRILKAVLGAMLGLAAVQQAPGFSVFGPAEGWQTPILDYTTRYYYGNDIEIGAPKNFNQGSRLNVPIITYAYDYTFLKYFGAKGVAAVDSAMNEMNRLPSASSVRLSKYLMQGNQAINYTAQALSVTDLKSTVMSLMLEHMGLTGETHVWDLRLRNPTPVTCEWGYDVVNRNYDPATHNPTAYVNGVQSGYKIWDGCLAGVQVADAIETTADTTSAAQYVYTAVATRYAQQVGGYYLGLTRDDMGGLAYLYSRNNPSYESIDSNSIVLGNVSGYAPVNPSFTNGATNGFSGLVGGVEKITYVKVAYDSLLGSAFTPRTYNYTIQALTNGAVRSLQVARTITQPDIIFAAGDLTVVPFSITPDNYPNAYFRFFVINPSPLVTRGSSPVLNGVISPQETITFNIGSPAYFNSNPSFLDSEQFVLYPTLLWGSFNGSTNPPVLFPNSSSITALELQILSSGSNASSGVYNPVALLGTNTPAGP